MNRYTPKNPVGFWPAAAGVIRTIITLAILLEAWCLIRRAVRWCAPRVRELLASMHRQL